MTADKGWGDLNNVIAGSGLSLNTVHRRLEFKTLLSFSLNKAPRRLSSITAMKSYTSLVIKELI